MVVLCHLSPPIASPLDKGEAKATVEKAKGKVKELKAKTE